MKSTQLGSPIVFLHLHKTGGSAIHHLLTQHLPPGSIAPKDRAGIPLEAAESIVQPVISGHVTARDIQSLRSAPRVFTILREPRERMLSQIYFLKSYTLEHLKTYEDQVALGIKGAEIGELLRSEDRNRWARDYYVKRLDPLYDPANPQATAPDLARAMVFLKSCIVVGVTSELQGFVREAFPYFGIAPDVRVPFVNRRQDLETQSGFEPVTVKTTSSDDEETIAELTSNDRELYDYAASVAPKG